MKHTRLLEIIREEIAGALNEIEKGEIELPKGTPPPAIKQYTDKGFDVKIVDPSTGKMVQKEAQLEEDALNEMAYDITIKNPEKLAKLKDEIKDSPKEGKKLLYKVIDIIQRDKKENKPIRQRDIANELEIIQQKVNPFVNLLIDLEILEKGESVKKKVTDKVQDKLAGEPKAEKPASTGKKGRPASEPKTEKTATLTKGDDGFDTVEYSDVDSGDKEATQNIGSDPTAKKLGKVADVSTNPDFNRILKGLQNKRKNSKEGVLSPENMKLAIDIINTAKDKYKFSPVEVEKLRAEINL